MLQALLDVALDLARSRPGPELYDRLVEAVRQVVPTEATALLRRSGDALIPVAVDGLEEQVLGRRLRVADHPRLEAICASTGPLTFPPDDPRPDPWDGLILGGDPDARVHACMGCPLIVEGEVVGALTTDALDPRAFEGVDPAALAVLAALAAASVRMAGMFEDLEGRAATDRQIARSLAQQCWDRDAGSTILGASLPIQLLRQEIRAVAPSDVSVLLLGETGTGKELVAKAIHAGSRRADKTLVHVNCAAMPESLAESELFGHLRGAFTGAAGDRMGKFELADGGTLFLDEIGELPLSIQPKLLRALQEGELQRVGADGVTRVDVRILAATNRDLAAEVGAGRFRPDLYHRLSVYPISVPPLRMHGDDVQLLAGAFLDRAAAQVGLGWASFTEEALEALRRHRWPGNVRELQHAVLRAAVRAQQEAADGSGDPVRVRVEHLTLDGPADLGLPLPPALGVADAPVGDFHEVMARFQRDLIRRAVGRADGNWSAAARELGLDRSNLHRMAQRLGLK